MIKLTNLLGIIIKFFRIIKKKIKTDFYKSVITLFSGSVFSQVIAVLTLPILTRIYTEKEMGVFFLFSSIIIVLSVFSTLKYSMSIILVSKNEEAINMVAASVLASVFIFILLVFLFVFFGFWIEKLFHIERLGRWIYFIPVSVLLNGLFDVFSAFYNRNKNYKIIASAKVTKITFTVFFQILIKYTFKKFGLILGIISGQIIVLLFYILCFFKKYKYFIYKISFNKIKEGLRVHKNIPIFNSLLSLSNSISNQLPIFLLSFFFGMEYVGLYGLANKIIAYPFAMVSQSINEVFYRDGAEKYNKKENLYIYLLGIYKKLFLIGIIPCILLAMFAPVLMKFFLGDNYTIAGNYTQILTPWLLIAFVSTPTYIVATIIKKQNILFYIDVFFLGIRLIALIIGGYYYKSVIVSIVLYSFSSFLYEITIILFFLKKTKKECHN